MSPDRKSPPSKRTRILFALLGAVGFVLVFVVGLWVTVELPTVAQWFTQGLITVAYIYGYTYRFGAMLGIIPQEKLGSLETAAVQHPLSYYVIHGLSMIWLLFIIVFFILIVGGTFWATRS